LIKDNLSTEDLMKYYGEMKNMELDDLSERSTIAHMPVSSALVSNFETPESFTAEKVIFYIF